jgi:hypothetical protein
LELLLVHQSFRRGCAELPGRLSFLRYCRHQNRKQEHEWVKALVLEMVSVMVAATAWEKGDWKVSGMAWERVWAKA